MSRRRLGTSLALLALLVWGVSGTADAQEVRRFGNDGSSSSGGGSGGGPSQGGTYYPGQPQPQTSQTSSQGGNTTGEPSGDSSSDDEGSGSYRIRLHGAGNQDDEASDSNQEGLSSAEIVERTPEKVYGGIIPGKRDTVDHLEASEGDETSSANRLTWLGFRPERARTRIFLQTARSPEYEMSRQKKGRLVVVTLPETRIASSNFSRVVDARYFERNVQTVRARPDGGDVRIEIALQESESPSVSTEGRYLYLDFGDTLKQSTSKQASRSNSDEE
jgi:hypothetical protein